MNVSIGSGRNALSFGRGMILTSLVADALRYGDEFPAMLREDLVPEARRVRIEGYTVAAGATPAARQRETEARRRMLSAIAYPGSSFILRVGDKYAEVVKGELVFKREAPFSGDDSEHFILTGEILGGFFHRSRTKITLRQNVTGMSLPYYTSSSGMTVGEFSVGSYAPVKNGGDVPVGFTGQFTFDRVSSSFCLTNTSTGQKIEARYAFAAGDTVKVSTLREDPYFKVTRNGVDINLTGIAVSGSELFRLYPGETVLELGKGAVYTGDVSFTESFVSF